MLYNFYIFNRKGKCLFYKEWERTYNNMGDVEEEKKLVFGMLFSLKDLASKLSPTNNVETTEHSTTLLDQLHTVKTNIFTLHHYQSTSGLMFIVNTHISIPDLHTHLQYIYSNIYVDCIARNPLYRHKLDEVIKCSLFVNKLEEYLFPLANIR